MQIRQWVALSILGGLLHTSSVVSATTASTSIKDPKLEFERYRLDNGLQVILHQDNTLPLVAVNVWYHVGAGDEIKGKSGFAHLFEHMLFQGSKNVGEDKHFAVLKNIGASAVNGTTNFNRTNYFETVPSHHIETALWLESDRMGYLLPMLSRKSLDNQIEVVRNERRQRTDNVPYGKSRLQMFELLYPLGHPYRGAIIGDHQDLASASVTDVSNFYKKWYVPANATLTLAGDFQVEEAKRLVQKWFGTLPKADAPKRKMIPAPKIKHERKVLVDKFAKLRQLTYAWHTPAIFEAGDAELDILADVLGSETGRLYKSLVHDKQWAQSVSAYQYSNQMSSAFFVTITLKPDADLKSVEALVEQELDSITKSPISTAELQRAVTNFASNYTWHLEGLMARVETLQSYNHFLGTPDFITKDLDRYRQATPEAINRIAKAYLKRQQRAEVLTLVKQ